MATIRYAADGAISPERFIAALTDFSDRRPALWPNLHGKWFKVHERGETWAEVTEGTDILGGIWARERYDWAEPGQVVLRVVESPHFRAGTAIEYTVSRVRMEAAMSRSSPRASRRACRVASSAGSCRSSGLVAWPGIFGSPSSDWRK